MCANIKLYNMEEGVISMSNTVSVTLTDEEYKTVVEEANKVGLSISQYVKRYPIGGDDFKVRYGYLREHAVKQPIGKKFTVMSLFPDWNSIERGVKLSLGRNFYHLVKRNELYPVVPVGKNSSNVQLYVVKRNYFLELNNIADINRLSYGESDFEVDKKNKQLYEDMMSFWNVQSGSFNVKKIQQKIYGDVIKGFSIHQENTNIRMTCDYIGPSRYYAKQHKIHEKEILDYIVKSREFGGHTLWPSKLIRISRTDKKGNFIMKSINTGRSYCFRERIDYTLFDIQNWFYGEYERMHKHFREILEGNKNWLSGFGEGKVGYKNFIHFFVFTDFVDDKTYKPYDLLSFDRSKQTYGNTITNHPNNFNYVPNSKPEFEKYIEGCLYAINKRTKRINDLHSF